MGLSPFFRGGKSKQQTEEECQKRFGMSHEDFLYQRKAALQCKRDNRYFSFRHRRSSFGWWLVGFNYLSLGLLVYFFLL